jgi:hypothetical protein
MRAVTRNKPALLLGLIAGALLVTVIVLLATDEHSSSRKKLPLTKIDKPVPSPKRTSGKRPPFAKLSAHLNKQESFFVKLTMEGTTLQWDGRTNNYEPTVNFQREAVLIVDPDGNFGIVNGTQDDFSAGRMWFVTNSYVLRHIPDVATFAWGSQIPAATLKAQGDTIEAVVGELSRTVQLNNFVVSNAPPAEQILSGRAAVHFSKSAITGELDLYGGGYIEPGNNFPVDEIRARFST